MYTRTNFKTKKALKAALADGERIEVFQHEPFGRSGPAQGNVCSEGPHFPAAHSWYASGTARDGVLISVR